LYHYKKPQINISFGPPLESYDGPDDEIKGIGSIIHSFGRRLPVFFLTQDGLQKAFLIEYHVSLTHQYRCRSDYPRLIFACEKNFEPLDILGVYIPYDDGQPSTCKIERPDDWLWTADFDGDGVPEIAAVLAGYADDDGEVVTEVLWFANFNGVWRVIDYGNEPECT
jgi:hypothetical protein